MIKAHNPHAKTNAAFKVDGYYFPRPHERATSTETVAFERAKGETVAALLQQIEDIKALTFEQYETAKAKDFRCV